MKGQLVATIAFKEVGEHAVYYGIAVVSKNESQVSYKKGRRIAEGRCNKAFELEDYPIEWQEYEGVIPASNDIIEILKARGLVKFGECSSQAFKDCIQELRNLGF
jgi:hypothetical protein